MEFLCCYTRLTLKEVDRIERNRWTESIGMSGQGRAEQVDRVVRNTHIKKKYHQVLDTDESGCLFAILKNIVYTFSYRNNQKEP